MAGNYDDAISHCRIAIGISTRNYSARNCLYEAYLAMDMQDLALREGCAVILTRESKTRFAGSTVDKQCKSSLRGASYATSRVVVTANEIRSWDRGYSDTDEQVWRENIREFYLY